MTYREVIRPPWWTYAFMAGLLALLCFTFAAVATVPVAVVLFVVLFAIGGFLVGRRRMEIVVDDERLQVGSESVPLSEIGGVTALDSAGMRMVAGPAADPRAHLILRNLATKQGVKVDLTAGSIPYWLVSSEHPEDLAQALSRR
jgi:Protein of unknown function (DUF3093)